MKFAMLCVLLIVIGYAPEPQAADWKPLKGTYAVTGKSVVDPVDGELKDSHFRLQLTGDAARDLFRAMKVPETKDGCTDALQKRVGEMRCVFYKARKAYECDFSIDVMRQKIEYGVSC